MVVFKRVAAMSLLSKDSSEALWQRRGLETRLYRLKFSSVVIFFDVGRNKSSWR